MTRRTLARALAVLLLVGAAAPAGARKAKVYKYETREGKTEYGHVVPEGSLILEEVGTIDVPDVPDEPGAPVPGAEPGKSRKDGVGELPLPSATAVERALESIAHRPWVTGGFVAGVFLLGIVLLRVFSWMFRTLDLSWDGAMRMVATIAVGTLLLAALGQALEFIWVRIGWSPRAEFGAAPMAAIALALNALVAVLVFRKRLGVGFVQAALIASLWFALVVGAAAAGWIFFVAAEAAR